MFPLMGTETEYGLLVIGKGPEYLAEETAALLRALPYPNCPRWDMAEESPLQDLRGFRVRSLMFNPRDAKFDQQGPPPASSAPVRVDRMLTNGARLYNDHGHPEYSTPECLGLFDLVAHDRAGEEILLACVREFRQQQPNLEVLLYKNNTDFHGFSYGTHENYLLPRLDQPELLLVRALPFFVSRQIFAGAGKVGVEGQRSHPSGFFYQLSQRADFFARVIGLDTLHRRPLLNTRDEPHADRSKYMRIHVILGDANRSQFALALKLGTTGLVLKLLAEGWAPPIELYDPVLANKEISRDQSRQWLVKLANGRQMSAVEIQALHLEAVRRRFAGSSPEVDWLIKHWEETLAALAADPLTLADRLDWPAKLMLLETYRQEVGQADVAFLQSLDLEYHNLDPQQSLFGVLERDGLMRRVVSQEEITAAQTNAPRDTRARIRGEAIRRFGSEIASVNWGRLCLNAAQIDLSQMVECSLESLNQQLEQTHSLGEFVETIRRWNNDRQNEPRDLASTGAPPGANPG